MTLLCTSVDARCYLTQGSIRQGKRLPCTVEKDARLRFSPSISASRMTEETVAAAGPGSPLLGKWEPAKEPLGGRKEPPSTNPLGLYRKLPGLDASTSEPRLRR